MAATASKGRVEILDGWSLRLRRAVSYVRTARDLLYIEHEGMRPIKLLPVDYRYLLDVCIETATEIIERLPDDFFTQAEVDDCFGLLEGRRYKFNESDEAHEAAVKLVALIEKRRGGGKLLRMIQKLEATEGRTPEEAEAFRSHAKRLRERMGQP